MYELKNLKYLICFKSTILNFLFYLQFLFSSKKTIKKNKHNVNI